MEAGCPRLTPYRGLLSFVALQVLQRKEEAEEAVENCLLLACHDDRGFESDAELRNRLVRMTLDEAVRILHWKKHIAAIWERPNAA